jgi:hypothetical protein
MKGSFAIAMVAALLAAGSCATVPVAGECPDSMGSRCLVDKVCSMDSKRGCNMCVCYDKWDQQPVKDDGRIPQPGVP